MEQDPLSQLRDIHIPPPDGFWPPAPGWWILLLVILCLIAGMVVLLRRRKQKNAWHRAANRDLGRLVNRAAVTSQWFNELNALLKRSAMARYPERRPESLSGNAWIDFLLETSPKDRIASRPVVTSLVESCYQPVPSCSTDDAVRFAQLWLGGQSC
ncbi:DUF4381 domain-containing protein [Marinobacter sp. CHS3-4]|uniref:DUF4381 domain-containing protein n=1 Tax=Marinobacter sp. CHS3-4 TaxID=3045174 RepID=UPI0024B48D73|nr:DUF4381 domain-containing protein [Marinobacter sp. CHS3-4]MDI9245866.1 DUF4381 domain-containing protein [Marinobacter sp. CHS3-4]